MSDSLTHSLTDSVFNKERKKERKSRLCLNFYLTNDDEDQTLLDRIETLRHRDRWSITRFLKEASLEYVNRHLPGNPGLPLEHWTKNEPFSEAAQEKLAPPPPPAPNYSKMTIQELEDCLKKRSLTDFDRMAINFFLKKKKEA